MISKEGESEIVLDAGDIDFPECAGAPVDEKPEHTVNVIRVRRVAPVNYIDGLPAVRT